MIEEIKEEGSLQDEAYVRLKRHGVLQITFSMERGVGHKASNHIEVRFEL